jgi:urocanate hydratase
VAAPNQSQRNLILDQIVLLLKTISVEAGDGTTPVLVTRDLLDADQVSAWPTLCVLEAQTSTVTLIETKDGGGSMGYQHYFGVSVYGYVKATESGRSRSQWLEDLWADVVNKIVNNYTLAVNGVELAMTIEPFGNRETDGGVLGEQRGAFVQDFAVIYVTGQPA